MTDSRPSLRPLARLWPFLTPYRGRLVLAFIVLTLAAAATLALPLTVRRVIDLGFSHANAEPIDPYFLLLFAVASVLAFFTAARHYLVSWLGERVVADLRCAVYRHVIGMSPVFFETLRTGEVLSRLTTDTTLIQTVVGTSLSMALRNIFLLVGSLALLAITSPRLTGITVILLLAVVLPLVWLGRRVRRLSRTSQDRVANSSALAGETLNAVQTVQSFTQENAEAWRFAAAVEVSFTTALRRIRTRAVLTALIIFLVFSAIVLVLWLGARLVLEGTLTAGALIQFVLYAVVVAGAIAALSEVWSEVQRAAGASERLMDLLAAVPAIRPPDHPVRLPRLRGEIRFQEVTFHYPSRPEQASLVDFTLHVQPGETVALVGPSALAKAPCSSCSCASTTRSRGISRSTGSTSLRPFRTKFADTSASFRRTR